MTINLKQFKPNLLPNEQIDLESIQYPMLASYKLDGIRAVFISGELYSRSLKLLPNIHLHNRFKDLKEYSKTHNCILDGELYCTSVPFNDLSGLIRSDDHELPEDLSFWCFDLLTEDNLPFEQRFTAYKRLTLKNFHPLVQMQIDSADEVSKAFDLALKDGFEGLVLRNPNSHYKFGRCTAKSNDAYKVKQFLTWDSKIVGVTQATEAREGSEKTINELGYSKTSGKKDDRVLINKAAAFVVIYEGKELKVTIALTDPEKEAIWQDKESYIGKTIEWKGMVIGSKDVPRHPVFLRYRTDK